MVREFARASTDAPPPADEAGAELLRAGFRHAEGEYVLHLVGKRITVRPRPALVGPPAWVAVITQGRWVRRLGPFSAVGDLLRVVRRKGGAR